MPNNIPNTDIVTKLAVETVINLCKFLETFYNSKFATSNNPSSMYQKTTPKCSQRLLPVKIKLQGMIIIYNWTRLCTLLHKP